MLYIISPSLFYTLLLPSLVDHHQTAHWHHRIQALRFELIKILESIQDYEIFHPKNYGEIKQMVKQLDIFLVDLRMREEGFGSGSEEVFTD